MRSTKKEVKITAEMILGLLILVFLIFLAIVAPKFFSIQSIMQMMRVFSYTFIAAIGMTMIFITGNTDISMGAITSVIAIVCALMCKLGLSFATLLPIGMVVGALLSAFNGFVITRFKLPAMVVTLATTQIYYGGLLLVVDGSVYNLPSSWTWFSFETNLFGVLPLCVLIAIILLVGFIIFFRYSRFVKKLYAIGNNSKGAWNIGINTKRTLMIVYSISGALLGFSALILATNGNRVTCTVGTNLEMQAIAAVIVGGTNAAGGAGKIYGTALGALLLAIVSPALVFMSISTYWTNLFMGLIIVVAIIASVTRQNRVSGIRESGEMQAQEAK